MPRPPHSFLTNFALLYFTFIYLLYFSTHVTFTLQLLFVANCEPAELLEKTWWPIVILVPPFIPRRSYPNIYFHFIHNSFISSRIAHGFDSLEKFVCLNPEARVLATVQGSLGSTTDSEYPITRCRPTIRRIV
jgi:hypothetical protein